MWQPERDERRLMGDPDMEIREDSEDRIEKFSNLLTLLRFGGPLWSCGVAWRNDAGVPTHLKYPKNCRIGIIP